VILEERWKGGAHAYDMVPWELINHHGQLDCAACDGVTLSLRNQWNTHSNNGRCGMVLASALEMEGEPRGELKQMPKVLPGTFHGALLQSRPNIQAAVCIGITSSMSLVKSSAFNLGMTVYVLESLGTTISTGRDTCHGNSVQCQIIIHSISRIGITLSIAMEPFPTSGLAR